MSKFFLTKVNYKKFILIRYKDKKIWHNKNIGNSKEVFDE